jgi:hypothetical protein
MNGLGVRGAKDPRDVSRLTVPALGIWKNRANPTCPMVESVRRGVAFDDSRWGSDGARNEGSYPVSGLKFACAASCHRLPFQTNTESRGAGPGV